MTAGYERRIARAMELMSVHPESAEILAFYCGLARIQSDIFDSMARDEIFSLWSEPHFSRLVEFVERSGPPNLATFARERLGSKQARQELFDGEWLGLAEGRFIARVIGQPNAEYCAQLAHPWDDNSSPSICALCDAKPVVAVLRGEGDGAKRSLVCSKCSTEWAYRRVVCPNCGEENKDQLPIYIAEQTSYIRVDACDTCKSYIKSVDLTKNGHAVPVVDELATVALNIWAEEHGYVKLETNLLGM
jgi:FdhE protein